MPMITSAVYESLEKKALAYYHSKLCIILQYLKGKMKIYRVIKTLFIG